MTGTAKLTPDGGIVRLCQCGNPLPPYSGRGRRPSKCDECKNKKRQRTRLGYERRRYKDDPSFRAMKRASSKQRREARKEARKEARTPTPDA